MGASYSGKTTFLTLTYYLQVYTDRQFKWRLASDDSETTMYFRDCVQDLLKGSSQKTHDVTNLRIHFWKPLIPFLGKRRRWWDWTYPISLGDRRGEHYHDLLVRLDATHPGAQTARQAIRNAQGILLLIDPSPLTKDRKPRSAYEMKDLLEELLRLATGLRGRCTKPIAIVFTRDDQPHNAVVRKQPTTFAGRLPGGVRKLLDERACTYKFFTSGFKANDDEMGVRKLHSRGVQESVEWLLDHLLRRRLFHALAMSFVILVLLFGSHEFLARRDTADYTLALSTTERVDGDQYDAGIQACQEYLSKHPLGSHRDQIRRKLTELQRAQLLARESAIEHWIDTFKDPKERDSVLQDIQAFEKDYPDRAHEIADSWKGQLEEQIGKAQFRQFEGRIAAIGRDGDFNTSSTWELCIAECATFLDRFQGHPQFATVSAKLEDFEGKRDDAIVEEFLATTPLPKPCVPGDAIQLTGTLREIKTFLTTNQANRHLNKVERRLEEFEDCLAHRKVAEIIELLQAASSPRTADTTFIGEHTVPTEVLKSLGRLLLLARGEEVRVARLAQAHLDGLGDSFSVHLRWIELERFMRENPRDLKTLEAKLGAFVSEEEDPRFIAAAEEKLRALRNRTVVHATMNYRFVLPSFGWRLDPGDTSFGHTYSLPPDKGRLAVRVLQLDARDTSFGHTYSLPPDPIEKRHLPIGELQAIEDNIETSVFEVLGAHWSRGSWILDNNAGRFRVGMFERRNSLRQTVLSGTAKLIEVRKDSLYLLAFCEVDMSSHRKDDPIEFVQSFHLLEKRVTVNEIRASLKRTYSLGNEFYVVIHVAGKEAFRSKPTTGRTPQWNERFDLRWRFGDEISIVIMAIPEDLSQSPVPVGDWNNRSRLPYFILADRLGRSKDALSIEFDFSELE